VLVGMLERELVRDLVLHREVLLMRELMGMKTHVMASKEVGRVFERVLLHHVHVARAQHRRRFHTRMEGERGMVERVGHGAGHGIGEVRSVGVHGVEAVHVGKGLRGQVREGHRLKVRGGGGAVQVRVGGR